MITIMSVLCIIVFSDKPDTALDKPDIVKFSSANRFIDRQNIPSDKYGHAIFMSPQYIKNREEFVKNPFDIYFRWKPVEGSDSITVTTMWGLKGKGKIFYAILKNNFMKSIEDPLAIKYESADSPFDVTLEIYDILIFKKENGVAGFRPMLKHTDKNGNLMLFVEYGLWWQWGFLANHNLPNPKSVQKKKPSIPSKKYKSSR